MEGLIDIFKIENDALTLDLSILIIPEFKMLWEETKDLDYFKAIHLLYHPRSQYVNMQPHQRRTQVEESFSKVDLTNPFFEIASQKYQEIMVTPSTRFFNAQKTLLDKLTNYCETVEINDSKDGNLTHIMRMIKEADNNLKSYKAVENSYLEELISSSAELSYDTNKDDTDDW